MTKTVADIEKKTEILDETEKTYKGLGWKLWVFPPLALVTIAGCAFLVVRRRFAENSHL